MTSRPLSRRRFLAVAGAATLAPRVSARAASDPLPAGDRPSSSRGASTPLVPFWFWNDRLEEAEILRQIADFEAHGVHGFVLHPRVGLPRDTGWMSPRLLGFMRVAIEEAARRRMTVFLYDEGMYPSGSSSGQVVATDPRFRCRGLDHRVLEGDAPPELGADHQLVAVVRRARRAPHRRLRPARRLRHPRPPLRRGRPAAAAGARRPLAAGLAATGPARGHAARRRPPEPRRGGVLHPPRLRPLPRGLRRALRAHRPGHLHRRAHAARAACGRRRRSCPARPGSCRT